MNKEDYALVVGIRRYPMFGATEAQARDLKGPDNDAQAIRDWLTDPAGGGVPKEQVTLIRSKDFPDPFPDNIRIDPQVQAIEDHLKRLERQALQDPRQRAGRRFYLYLSGHGYAEKRNEGAVFGANATRILTDHLPASEWAERFATAGYFDEVVLWMDCCMVLDLSVPMARLGFRRQFGRRGGGKLFAAFAARFPMEAVEQKMDDGEYHGLFTYALLQGLRGEAADPLSKEITSESIKRYLINAMPQLMHDEYRKNPYVSQEPDFGPMDNIVFGAVLDVPTHAVKVHLPPAAVGKTMTVKGGPLPVDKPLTVSISATEETLQLPKGIYIAQIEDSGLKDFTVVGGELDVRVGE